MVNYRKPELGKDELEGFENYVRSQYVHDLEEAVKVMDQYNHQNGFVGIGARPQPNDIALAVFDKLATPRVFLIESWRKLEDSERLSYYSKDYQDKAKAEAKAISKKASEALSQ